MPRGNFTVNSGASNNESTSGKAKSTTQVKKEPIDFSKLNIKQLEFWPKIINQLKEERKMLIASNLMNTMATLINDMTVGIVFKTGLTPFIKGVMERPENMQELTRLISIECGAS